MDLAIIRPDEWNLVLFFHVLGAMVAVGGLVLAALYLWGAWRESSAERLRHGYRALLLAALPGYLVMRVFAQLIYDKEGLDQADSDPAWIGIGFIVSDLGALLLVVSIVLTGLAVRRAGNQKDDETGGATGIRVATGLISFLLAAYVVAVWAMTVKPV